MVSQLQQEIKIQSFAKHPNIVRLYGFFSDSSNIYMLLELAEGNIFR
jgi:serine/threonine protein kinase